MAYSDSDPRNLARAMAGMPAFMANLRKRRRKNAAANRLRPAVPATTVLSR